MSAKMWLLLVFTSSLVIHLVSAAGDGEGTSQTRSRLYLIYRAVARGGIGGVVNPPNFCRINIFGKSGWPFGKLRQ